MRNNLFPLFSIPIEKGHQPDVSGLMEGRGDVLLSGQLGKYIPNLPGEQPGETGADKPGNPYQNFVGPFNNSKNLVLLWINVPELKPVGSQVGKEDQMVVKGLKGSVTDPVKLGFVMSDLRVVANKDFLADNPAAKRFFELVKIDLADINAQNAKLFEGEDSAKDIQGHVVNWISENQKTWDSWLAAARNAAQ